MEFYSGLDPDRTRRPAQQVLRTFPKKTLKVRLVVGLRVLGFSGFGFSGLGFRVLGVLGFLEGFGLTPKARSPKNLSPNP